MNTEKITLEQIKEMSRIAVENNIAIASHDDDDIEKLSLVKSFGTTISEFPTTIRSCEKSKRNGSMDDCRSTECDAWGLSFWQSVSSRSD